MSKFLSALCVEQTDEEAGLWMLTAPLHYQSDILGRVITVPTDFVTDFASIPRIPFVYDAEGGKCNCAAVAHDWLYSTQCVDRATADKVLREAILASGYSGLTAGLFYVAVRAFGASHWKQPNVPQTMSVDAAMRAQAAISKAGAGAMEAA